MTTTVRHTEDPTASSDRSHAEMLAGMRAMAPMLVAYAPFGLLVGAAVADSDHRLAAWLSTWTIYGGAAHLAVLDVLRHDAGVTGAAFVGLLVNARMLAYSMSLTPHWREAPVGSRVAAAAMLTDAVWGLTTTRDGVTPRARRGYYFGAGLVLWFGWPALVTVGLVVGHRLDAPVLGILPALTLGTLVVAQLRTRPALAAAGSATAVALTTGGVDAGPALALAALAGTSAAVWAHRRTAR